MSRLDELIAELCPDGVEYKTIGELATDIYRGSGITSVIYHSFFNVTNTNFCTCDEIA